MKDFLKTKAERKIATFNSGEKMQRHNLINTYISFLLKGVIKKYYYSSQIQPFIYLK